MLKMPNTDDDDGDDDGCYKARAVGASGDADDATTMLAMLMLLVQFGGSFWVFFAGYAGLMLLR